MTERITADAMEMTYRTYLLLKAAREGVEPPDAPPEEWDMETMRTYSEWDAAEAVGRLED